jgi:hypothetical protein
MFIVVPGPAYEPDELIPIGSAEAERYYDLARLKPSTRTTWLG